MIKPNVLFVYKRNILVVKTGWEKQMGSAWLSNNWVSSAELFGSIMRTTSVIGSCDNWPVSLTWY